MKLYGTDKEIVDTTGQVVLATYRASRNCSFSEIGMDTGHYAGTKEEYNVRTFASERTLPGIDWYTLYTWINDNKLECYGYGWGDSNGMYLLSAANIRDLDALNSAGLAKLAEARARKEAAEAEAEKHYRLAVSNVCTKCGTYCYGDCEASEKERTK